jgi:hypothetical protein
VVEGMPPFRFSIVLPHSRESLSEAEFDGLINDYPGLSSQPNFIQPGTLDK